MSDAIVWHDVECGAYTADLPLWRELADQAAGPILELGAGTGRVALDLAEQGHDVTALDSDAALLAELARRARERELSLPHLHADARAVPRLDNPLALVLAPMQLAQLMGGPAARAELLSGVVAALRPGGRFAAALAPLDEVLAPVDAAPPLPDVGERDGRVYSSLPLDVRPDPGGIAVERLRQVVSPAGQLSEERHTLVLDALSAEQLEEEATAAGLTPEAQRAVDATGDHVGSTVVVCRR